MAAVAGLQAALVLAALCMSYAAAADLSGVKTSAKCPIRDYKRYNDIIKNDMVNNKWFEAQTTSTGALHQAAYAFDAQRVECLLTNEKANPNAKVPTDGGLPTLATPLGAVIAHIDSISTKYDISDDMVNTVQALLKAGAKPDIVLSPLDTTPLGYAAFWAGPRNSAQALKIAKALVAAGADVNYPAGSSDNTPLGYLVISLGSNNCKDPAYKQFIDFLISKGADIESATANSSPFGDDPGCPELLKHIKDSAATQKTGRRMLAY